MLARITKVLAVTLIFAGEAFCQGSNEIPVPLPVPFPASLEYLGVSRAAVGEDIIQEIVFDQGAREFKVKWRERVPGSYSHLGRIWRENNFTVALTYRVTDIAFREGGNEIYVAGLHDDGRGVIKLFTFTPRPNGLYVRGLPLSVEPRGTATDPHSAEQVLNGSSWSEPTASSYGVPSRSFVLGDTIGVPRAIAADPAGRYLLILAHGSSKLYLLDLTVTPKVLELVAEPTTFPQLLPMDDIQVLTKVGGGQVAVIQDSSAFEDENEVHHILALVDDENDGVIDDIIATVGESGLEANGLGHHDIATQWVIPGVAQW